MDRPHDTDARGQARRLAERLDQRIPDGAVALLVDGAAIIAWKAEPSVHSPCVDGVIALHRVPGSHAYLSSLGSIPFEPEAIHRAVQDVPGMPLPVLLRYPARPKGKGGGPVRGYVFRKMLEGVDVAALMLMEEIGYVVHARQEWLDSTGPGGARVHAFARAHPWLVQTAAAMVPDPVREAPGHHGPDAIAAGIVDLVLGEAHPRTGELVDRLRGFVLSEDAAEGVTEAHLRALLALPRDLFPPDPLVGADRRGPAQQGMLACFALAPDALYLSELSGRPVRSLLAKGGDWAATAQAIGDRYGGEFGKEDYPEDWGCLYPENALRGIMDMVVAFAEGVLAPALLGRGTRWDCPPIEPDFHAVTHFHACRDGVLAGALRLLLGQRGLPALAEACADWHARAAGISGLINELRTGAALSGPVPVDDRDLGRGLYVTCLATPEALHDEGAPGPDAAGAPGLDHCVGSYSDRVLRGETTILSLRQRDGAGYRRLSTAEIRFGRGTLPTRATVVQHMGRGNTDPPRAAKDALALLLPLVEAEAQSRLVRFEPDPRLGARTATVIHEAGAWTRMRDAWGFALPRPLRSVGPAELLAAAGIPPGDAGAGGVVPL